MTLHRGQSTPAMGHKARAQEHVTRRSTSKEGVAEDQLPTGGAGGPSRTGRSQSSVGEGHTRQRLSELVLRAPARAHSCLPHSVGTPSGGKREGRSVSRGPTCTQSQGTVFFATRNLQEKTASFS